MIIRMLMLIIVIDFVSKFGEQYIEIMRKQVGARESQRASQRDPERFRESQRGPKRVRVIPTACHGAPERAK